MRFRLFHLAAHANFTRNFTATGYEIPLIKAAWPKELLNVKPLALPDTREVNDGGDPAISEYGRLCGAYGQDLVRAIYPHAETLSVAMSNAAEETARWEEQEATKAKAAHAKLRAEIDAKAKADAAAKAALKAKE